MSRSRGEPKAAAVAELAPKLAAPGLAKDALLKTLKQASGLLAELGQVASASVKNTIKPFVEAVGQQSIVRHKDKDVKLLAASCISEVLRLCAPDAPYEDPTLKDIFRLFTSVFEGLNEVTGSSYLKRVAVLESLSKVKSCVMILDLDDEELVLRFMETLFDAIHLEQGRHVRMAILEVLAILIEESEDITQPFLDLILSNLFAPKKNENPAAHQLAQALLKREAEVLRNPLQQFLLSVMLKGKSDSDLKKDYHDIIYEVYRSAPQLLLTVLPNLEGELQVDQVETRLKAIDLLGKIFCILDDQAATEYRPLYNEFVNRFNDKNVEVRAKMVQWTQNFLPSAPDAQAKEISEKLQQRLNDYDDKIRAQAAAVACEVASVSPDTISVELLKAAADRMRDKKVFVRKDTLKAFTQLYKAHANLVLQGQGREESKFAWIPARIVRLVYDKDIKYQHIESVFEEELFPAKLPNEQRARHWVSMFSMLDEVERKGLAFLFTLKKRAQQEMRDYLDVRQQLKESPDDAELLSRKAAAFRALSSSFLEPNRAAEHLTKLDQLKDNGIFKGLAQLLDTGVSMAAAKKAQEDVLKRLGQKHAQHDFLKVLAQKVSYNLVSKDLVTAILGSLTSDQAGVSSNLLGSAVDVVVAIASSFPHLLADSVDTMLGLLEEDSDLLKDAGTQLLAKVGSQLNPANGEASQVGSTLEKLCLGGTRKQAKNAMLALLSLGEEFGSQPLSDLYEQLYSALIESDNLPAVIQSLGCIAQHKVDLFEKREDDIIRYVIRNIMKRPSDTGAEQEWDSPSEACLLQTYCLKMLVKSFLHQDSKGARTTKLKGLLNLLSKLISGNGQLVPGVESSEVDKAHVRLAAAKGIVRLSRYHHIHIVPDLTEKTSLVVQDHAVEVRRDFLAKVRGRLVDKKLPTKWAVVLSLATVDDDRDIASDARRFLAEFVELKRREGHAKQAAVDGEKPENVLAFHPEMVLVYLLHLLAHHPDFPGEEEAEDASAYEIFQKVLVFTLKALTHSDADSRSEAIKEENDNLPALFAILRHIKGAEDAVEPSMSERLYVLTDLSLAILKELTSKKLWNSGAYPGEVLLPSAYYKVAEGEEAGMENEVVKTKADGSHLPKCLQNLELTKVAKTPRAPKAANGGLGSPMAKVGSAMKKDGGALALTGRKRKASQKKMTAASDEEESDEEEEAAPLPKTPKTSTKSKAGTLTIPKATPKPLAVVSPPWKEEAANAADSEAVGKRIRVWWPEDKVYYQGDVTGFNPKKGTHRILYDDGDREELNLAKQRWDFVDDLGQLRDSEEDRARKSGVRALTAPATPGRRGHKSPPSKKRSAKKRKASAGEEESEEESEGEKEPPKRKTAPRGKKTAEVEPPPEGDEGEEMGAEVAEAKGPVKKGAGGGGEDVGGAKDADMEKAEPEEEVEEEEKETPKKAKRGKAATARKRAGKGNAATPKGGRSRKKAAAAEAVSNEAAESPGKEKAEPSGGDVAAEGDDKKGAVAGKGGAVATGKAASPKGRKPARGAKAKRPSVKEAKTMKQVKAGISEKDEEEANEKLEVEEVEERPSKRRKGITAVDSESQEPSQIEAPKAKTPKSPKSDKNTTEAASPSEGGPRGRKPKGGAKRAAPRRGAKGKAAEPASPPSASKSLLSSPAFDWNETQDDVGEEAAAEQGGAKKIAEEGKAKESGPELGAPGVAEKEKTEMADASDDDKQGKEAAAEKEGEGKPGVAPEETEDGEGEEDSRPTTTVRSRKRRVR